MKNKKCDHRDFRQVYGVINLNTRFSDKKGRNYVCKSCGKECVMKWRGYDELQKNSVKKFFTYFLWLVPAILVIYGAVNGFIGYIWGMVIITMFHFVSMYYIIKSDRLEISEKK